MRVLLAANASYAPPRGGSTRSNLVWLRALSSAGHECRVVSTLPEDRPGEHVPTRLTQDGIEILPVRNLARETGTVAREIRSFAPDWVFISSEDLSHVLLREAHENAPDRLIYLAHTPQFFPFGPESWNPDARAAAIVEAARAIVAIGEHMAGYIERALGVRPRVIHPPIYGVGPFVNRARFGEGLILMINPCAVKGISIFQALARRFPERSFGALVGWGATARDLEQLAALPNVTVLGSVPGIDDVLSQAAVLLMPSLWYEGFGLIVMEAMLRGLPVISSDSGGLVEAKRGSGFVIPVRPIERYLAQFDETHMPKPVIPEQDIEPWAQALTTLLSVPAAYEEESRRSFAAAVSFVERLRAADFEDLLHSLTHAESPAAGPALERLSPEKRALLLRRLRRRLPQ
jgi:glycosyltransferase involved in cell wall biosynthesis